MRIRLGSSPDGDAHVCTCGHLAGGHRHYRRGTDCSVPGCPCLRFESPDSPAVRARALGKRLRSWLARTTAVVTRSAAAGRAARSDQA